MQRIVSFGTVVPSSTHFGILFGKPIIYPDGYTMERAVFMSSTATAKKTKSALTHDPPSTAPIEAAKADLYFTATILWAGGQPTFTVTRSDNPSEKKYQDTKSPTTAWRKAFEDAAKDFPDRRAELAVATDSKSKLQVNGIRLYCLHLREVHDELVRLPGGQGAFEAAAAASFAATSVPAAVTVVEEELDARSTSLLSSPDPRSQPRTREKRDRTVSPMPKVSAKTSTERLSGTPSGKKQPSLSTRASVEEDVSPEATTTTLSDIFIVSGTPTKERPAKSLVKKPQTRRQKGDGKVAVKTESTAELPRETEGITTASSVKRRRTSTKTVNSKDAPPSVAAVTPCPQCGLSGTAFCAATGKPHLPPPCATCGLNTSFCPVTGQPHDGTVHRKNRQRGEVHLPGATRKPRRSASKRSLGAQGATDTSAEVAEVAVISTQDEIQSAADTGKGAGTTKKPRRKRLRAEDDSEQVSGDGVDISVEGMVSKAARVRRVRKMKAEAMATASSSEPLKMSGNETIKDGNEADFLTTVVVKTPHAPVEEQVYTYPPLRPPLTIRERHKAAQLLQESWKVQYGDGPVLPAAVAAVHLPLIPTKRVVTNGASRRRKEQSEAAAGGVSGEEGKQSEGEDDDDGGEEETGGARSKGGDGHIDLEKNKNGNGSTAERPTQNSAAPLSMPTMVHPLEVTQLATSAAGKRLSRFLVQYTSERTLLDLLKSAGAANGGAGKKGLQQLTQKSSVDGDAGGGGTESARDEHTSKEGDIDGHSGYAPSALPTDKREDRVACETHTDDGGVKRE